MKFKVVIIGDSGVGKTAFVSSFFNSDLQNTVPTIGVNVHSIQFNTNQGPIQIDFWDCAGKEELGGLRDGYWIDAHFAFIFCDYTKISSRSNLSLWSTAFKRVNPGSPIFFIGNKSETNHPQFTPQGLISISVKNRSNISSLIIHALRKVIRDPTLELI